MATDVMTDAVQAALRQLDETRAIDRLHGRDGSLWSDDNETAATIVKRLGWLTCVPTMSEQLGRLINFVRRAERRGYDRALIVGMGGSSLWPEVVGRHLAGHRGMALRVADSVHPRAIRESIAWCKEGKALFVIATKSGTTVETLSLYRVLRREFDDGSRFVAVTDPHSELARLAQEELFVETFLNPPDIGGRFSAASFFGLVPAALAGVVIKDALARIEDMLEACKAKPAQDNPGAELAAFLAAGHQQGHWHLRLAFGRDVRGFAAWVEQLVAESTGKHGTGLLPVPGAFKLADDARAGPLKHSIVASLCTFAQPGEKFARTCEEQGASVMSLVMPEAADLWAEVVRWEVGTALCGKLLGINPFDEPDVSAAKAATNAILDGSLTPVPADSERRARKLADISGMLKHDLSALAADDYLAVLLYIAPIGADRQRAASLREALQQRTNAAVTVQFGPRYLHSTGQLHKGGPDKGHFVVVHDLDGVDEDVDIPHSELTALRLIRAQMQGDVAVLKERNKPVQMIVVETGPQGPTP